MHHAYDHTDGLPSGAGGCVQSYGSVQSHNFPLPLSSVHEASDIIMSAKCTCLHAHADKTEIVSD